MPGDSKVWILILIIFVLICLIIFVVFESKGYKTVSYSLYSDKFSGDNLRIAFLADLHNKDFGNYNEALIHTIDDFKPDIVCFSGDMVTSGWDVSFDYSHTLKFIEKLSAKYPIYYSPGNHEDKFDVERDKFPYQYDELVSELNRMKVCYLDNKSVRLDNFPVRIYGLRLPHSYFNKLHPGEISCDLLNDALGAPDKECFSLLLAHDPRHFDKYAEWGADLTLSGHVHGGIVSLPFIGGVIAPGMRLFPKYDAGLFTDKESLMILTRGIGSHFIPIRINNKAEVVFINISKEK